MVDELTFDVVKVDEPTVDEPTVDELTVDELTLYHSFHVLHHVNRDDRHLLACAMASNFSVTK
jgi:hypothetical protein